MHNALIAVGIGEGAAEWTAAHDCMHFTLQIVLQEQAVICMHD